MALKTRKPTGRAGWPKILVEGGDKAGKSWSLAVLSASPKIGRTVVLALGEDETRWDEYGKIPGARFEIAVHDGTWNSIMGAVEDAKDEATKARDAGEKPFVLGIDTITAEWEGLKDWASLRARGSKKNRKLLEEDPNAEIDVTSNYWNDARARHRSLMRVLLTFPGIVVLIARGSEVTLFQNGQPVANRKTWSVEGEKNLPFDVSTHIRLSRDARPLLVSASGVHCQIRPGIDRPRPLPDDWSLESVIFDTLKLDATSATASEFVEFKQDLTPEQIRDELVHPQTDIARVRELYVLIQELRYSGVEMANESNDTEPLLAMAKRIGSERSPAPRNGQHAPPSAPSNGSGTAQQQTPAPNAGRVPEHPAEDSKAAVAARTYNAADDPVAREWAAKIDDANDLVAIMALNDELGDAERDGQVGMALADGIRAAIEAKRLRLASGQQAQPGTQRPTRPRGPSAEERGAVAVPTGRGDDGEWVQGFMQRLTEAGEDDLSALQAQIGNAVRAKTISPAKSADLSKAIRERGAELQKVPA